MAMAVYSVTSGQSTTLGLVLISPVGIVVLLCVVCGMCVMSLVKCVCVMCGMCVVNLVKSVCVMFGVMSLLKSVCEEVCV